MKRVATYRSGWIIVGLGLAVACGCASQPHRPAVVASKPPPTTRPVVNAPPVLNIARGGAGLPLEDSTPIDSLEALKSSFGKALQRRMVLPEGAELMTLQGDDLGHLDLLKVNISEGSVREDFRPAQNKNPSKPAPTVAAKQFEYVAWPVYYQKLPTWWRTSATDARLGLIKDANGKQILVLTDVREGHFDFSVRMEDLKKPRVIVRGPSTAPSPVSIQDVDLQLASDDPHNLSIQMQIKATVLLVPVTVRLKGRADIDQWCNLKLSDLSCEGLDTGGKLAAAFAKGPLEKCNGMLMPLVRWPEDRVVLTDVEFHLDDSLNISATFAGRQYVDDAAK